MSLFFFFFSKSSFIYFNTAPLYILSPLLLHRWPAGNLLSDSISNFAFTYVRNVFDNRVETRGLFVPFFFLLSSYPFFFLNEQREKHLLLFFFFLESRLILLTGSFWISPGQDLDRWLLSHCAPISFVSICRLRVPSLSLFANEATERKEKTKKKKKEATPNKNNSRQFLAVRVPD